MDTKPKLGLLVSDPAAFFDALDDEPSRRQPLLVIGSLVGLYVVGNYLTSRYFFDGAWLVISLVSAALGPVIILGWFAGGFQVISRFQDGEGSFRRTWTMTAYGLLPLTFGMCLTIVAGIVASPPDLVADPTRRTLQRAATSYYQQPLLYVAGILNSALFLVSGYLWISGLQWARGLSRQNATIAVLVMLGLSGAYSLLTGQLV